MGACTLGPTCGRSSLCNGCETPVYACIVLYACCSSSSRQPHIWLAARRVCTATCATCNATGHLHVQCHALSCSASLAYEEEKHGACGWMEGADCAGTQRVHVVPTTRGTRLSSGARLAAVAGRYTWSAALEVCTTPSCARPGSGALTSLAYEDKRRGGWPTHPVGRRVMAPCAEASHSLGRAWAALRAADPSSARTLMPPAPWEHQQQQQVMPAHQRL